ncbi:MAG: hypothetical protein Q8Q94_03895 [bacterium]|nr:hypothetical protein [bacterium]MDZ4285369.1 hypothetical protein [Candidatus Sungbacteria bacterium]
MKEKKKLAVMIAVGTLLLSSGSFYAGIRYGQTGNQASRNNGSEYFANGPAGIGTGRGSPSGRGGTRNGAAGFTSGEVIAKDTQSITLKIRDGGSKIILYSPSTMIEKPAPGTATDLLTGTQLVIMGDANADGSITAKNIQIRPQAPAGTAPPQLPSDN